MGGSGVRSSRSGAKGYIENISDPIGYIFGQNTSRLLGGSTARQSTVNAMNVLEGKESFGQHAKWYDFDTQAQKDEEAKNVQLWADWKVKNQDYSTNPVTTPVSTPKPTPVTRPKLTKAKKDSLLMSGKEDEELI